MQIVLVKCTDEKFEQGTPDHAAMRRFMFEMISGATEKDTRAWNRFARSLNESPRGSYFTIEIKRQRNTQFHKLVFAVMLAVYSSQETFSDMEIFRYTVKLGAGFCVYVPDPHTGELKAQAKSQSFDDCSEEECREFFQNMCAFFRSATCCAMLWPQAPIEQSMAGMDRILRQFDME